MAALTNYAEALLIDWLLRKDAVESPIRPSTIYLSLHHSDPGETGSYIDEVSAGAYVRMQALFSSSSGTGDTANSGTITYPTATASWGLITHWGLGDSLTGGNMLIYGIANGSQTINIGNTYSVAAGSLTLRFD